MAKEQPPRALRLASVWARKYAAPINLVVTAIVGIAAAVNAQRNTAAQMELQRELEGFRQSSETEREERTAERQARVQQTQDAAEHNTQLIREGELMVHYVPLLFGAEPRQRELALATLTATMPLTGPDLLSRLAAQNGDESLREAARGVLDREEIGALRLEDPAVVARLIEQFRGSREAVREVVRAAQSNTSAVNRHNALTFLSEADRPTLLANRAELEALMATVEVEEEELVANVRRRLWMNDPSEHQGTITNEECAGPARTTNRATVQNTARCIESVGSGLNVRRFGIVESTLSWGVNVVGGNIVRCECDAAE